ncbi:MAG: hypothetical protein ACI9J3_000939 [Parvicellaceae bacterium]|jgi:hypothetical protein
MEAPRSYSSILKTLLLVLPEALLVCVFFYIQLLNVNLDFWNDEIYTLKHFTFVPIQNTLTDYHVPNNHILFNLINNLYLKLINVESLHELMDAPYKLRIVPLVYSFLTVVFVYKIALKNFNRFIGLCACAILITTVPYFNFALQIRGYGISTLLLVLIVYFCTSYLKSGKNFYLILITLASALTIYAIPSNVYPILCILMIYSVYSIISIIKKVNSKNQFKIRLILIESHFRVLIAILLGILFCLAFYWPIFTDVFMNEYVISGPSFVFSKLEFYFSHIIQGMTSGRWLLALLSLVGLIFAFKKQITLRSLIILMVVICIAPIILIYVRGDKAPLRVLVVLAPFFSMLFAVGIYSCWKILFKRKYIFDYVLIGIVSVYSLFTFNYEIAQIDALLLADIKEEKRSQNLYHQYYSANYQPLKDLTYFNEVYDRTLPVLIHGGEAHGVPNYLNKFNIPFSHKYYQSNALDSLLLEYDSIYIITNHPYSFETMIEYETVLLSKNFSYHNALLLRKKQSFYAIDSQLNSLSSIYEDSIGYVFNVCNSTAYESFINKNDCYIVTDSNQHNLGELLQFKMNKPYLCYLETCDRNSLNIKSIVKYGNSAISSFDYPDVKSFCIVSKIEEDMATDTAFYYNDYEQIQRNINEGKLVDSAFKFSGTFSQKLDSEHLFSSRYTHTMDRSTSNLTVETSFISKFSKATKGLIILSVTRDKKQLIWEANRIEEFFNSKNEWQKIISTFLINDTLKVNDVIDIYIWNPGKENIWIDDLKINLPNLASKKSLFPPE